MGPRFGKFGQKNTWEKGKKIKPKEEEKKENEKGKVKFPNLMWKQNENSKFNAETKWNFQI